MSNLNKLIKAIKLRDVNQVRTILDDDGKLVHAYDETGATALHYATFGGLAKSSNCCSTEAQKSTAETGSSVLRQPVGVAQNCLSRLLISAPLSSNSSTISRAHQTSRSEERLRPFRRTHAPVCRRRPESS